MKGALIAAAAGSVAYFAVSWGAYYAGQHGVSAADGFAATPNLLQAAVVGSLIGLAVYGAGKVL